MISLDDPRWAELQGGYRIPYDASPALKRLEMGEDTWDELKQELINQGDVGEASYAAATQIIRIGKTLTRRDERFYNLLTAIEIERHRPTNPPLPAWLEADYQAAWDDLQQLALADYPAAKDQNASRPILATLALAKGDLKLGAIIGRSDDGKINEILEEYDAWAEIIRLTRSEGQEEAG